MKEQIKAKMTEYKATDRRWNTAEAVKFVKSMFPAESILEAALEWHKEQFQCNQVDPAIEKRIKVILGLSEGTQPQGYSNPDSADSGYRNGDLS